MTCYFFLRQGYLSIWNTSTVEASVMPHTKKNVAFWDAVDLAAIAQCLLFSRSSHSHNPDLVQIQMRTFLPCAKKKLSKALRTKTAHFVTIPQQKAPMIAMFYLFFNYFSPDSRQELEPPACPSRTITQWKTKVHSWLCCSNINTGARNHSA